MPKLMTLTLTPITIMVDFTISTTLLNCRRELRFPTLRTMGRDSEIDPTEEM